MLEPVEVLNRRLKDLFGRFDTTDHPMWRVVWSEDQIEKRWTEYTNEGFQLLQPEVRELPKYRQWVDHKYILERLTVFPSFVERDVVDQLTYEPVWVFEDAKGNPLPPKWEAIELIITNVLNKAAAAVGAKYKDPNAFDNSEDAREARLQKVDEMVETLFGNETDLTTSLSYGEGISVPSNYERKT